MKNASKKARTISIEVYIPRQWKDHSHKSRFALFHTEGIVAY